MSRRNKDYHTGRAPAARRDRRSRPGPLVGSVDRRHRHRSHRPAADRRDNHPRHFAAGDHRKTPVALRLDLRVLARPQVLPARLFPRYPGLPAAEMSGDPADLVLLLGLHVDLRDVADRPPPHDQAPKASPASIGCQS
jgi:hypothetical protein